MSRIEEAAALLVEGRRSGGKIAELPAGLMPTTAGEAYAVQDETIKQLGAPIGGWKVTPIIGDMVATCSPIPADMILPSPATLSAALLSNAELEVEIGVRFAADLPPRPAPYKPDDVIAAIGAVFPAFEIVVSRFNDRKAADPLATLADCQSNGAVVYGKDTAWTGVEFGTVGMTLLIDGAEGGRATGGPLSAQVLNAIAWLADHAAGRGKPIRAGQIVMTGSRIGPMPLPVSAIKADIDGIGSVSATYR